MSVVPDIELHDGVKIPQLGFGVFQVPLDETKAAVRSAIEAGYRHIDTAAIYGNEEGVGQAIAESGVPRDELFIVTKLWNEAQGYDSTLRAFDESLGKLGIDVLDLYLIHWPSPHRNAYVDTWKAFEKLHKDGRIRSIGVSNFHAEHLDRLVQETELRPTINQIELHPRLPQQELRLANAKYDIVTEAWSPLARAAEKETGLFDEPALKEISEKHGKTIAQVVLRWHIQLGNVVIPKSVKPARIAENIDVFDFALDEADLAAIAKLETGDRVGPNPATATF
ncbi:aldo/keto reductase [Pseudonocardiaceae bacterium YIM PH 21723]|nr:aldo/keto reductase [Pseudonocardiaceae bacterium YIM PH 21723]